MHISKQTKQEIENLFFKNDFNCRSVSISEKEIDGNKTSEICIKIGVPRKKAKSELRPEEIVPEELEIDGKKYKTDVVEMPEIKSMACFSDFSNTTTEPNILKLQGNPQLLTPLKGGQEIIQFPTGWQDNGGGSYGYNVGTLGFFCVDNLDEKLVGITNSHVVIPEDKLLFSGDKDPAVESTDPFNTIDEKEWIVDNQNYPSAARSIDVATNSAVDTAFHIKRYHPFKTSGPNYVDAALIIMNPTHVSENESFKIHHPDGITESNDKLPFATASEIDSLLDNPKPKLFSTGRTTGPKGWGTDNACLMEATDVSISQNVIFGGGEIPFNDLIRYRHLDESAGVIAGGDSGSVVLAEFAGIKKVVGLAFAGPDTTNDFALACRIDRIVDALKIREWDSSYIFDATVPIPTILRDDIENATADQLSIIQNGKEYFQVGTTTDDTITKIS